VSLISRRVAALLVGSTVAASAAAQVPSPPAVPPPAQPPAVVPPAVVPTAPPAAKPEPPPTGIAAKVNGQEIPEKNVWRALRTFAKEEHEIARKEILSHLTENALIDQYLNALKIAPEAGEVEKLIGELKAELAKAMPPREYLKELESMALTEAEFRAEVTAQMKWDKFLSKQGTDEALKQMFNAAPDMFDGSMVRARHVLLTPGEDKAKQAEALQKLRGIKQVVEQEAAKAVAALPPTASPLEKDQAKMKRTDELFAAYAKQESTCPSKKDGGDLNFFPRVGAMVEAFAKAAFAAKPGDMTDVVVTDFGYHLILVTAKNPGKLPTFEQAKEAVRAVYAMRLREAVLAQMKKTAKIEIMTAGK
jgi:peptidyl-prolyl cis-trans isomerase C